MSVHITLCGDATVRKKKLNIGLSVFFGVLLVGVAFACWVVYALYTGRLTVGR